MRTSALLRVAAFFFLLILFTGCRSEFIRTEAGERVDELADFFSSLSRRYSEKDLPSVLDHLDRPLASRLRAQLERDFKTFSQIDLKLVLERLEMNGEISASVRWRGLWRRGEGEPLSEQGNARFSLVRSQEEDESPAPRWRVATITGEIPFGISRPLP